MLGDLLKEAPHIWKLIREQLIGNGGKPEPGTGNALGGIVRETEIKHNAALGSYWYRFFRPDDPGIGGSAATFHTEFTTVTEENLLSLGAVITVPTGEALASFGWYCRADLGKTGYLHVKKEGIVKSEIPARIVYRQQDPDHFFIDLDTYIVGHENARIDWVIYNGLPSTITTICIPLLFRIAPRAALNLEKSVL